MRVLVTAASRHGATDGIAGAIAETLRDEGLDVVMALPEEATLEDVGAVVIGSGVYAGKWLEPAKRFVDANAATLRTLPVWLFSSGPLGDPPVPAGEPADATPMLEATGAREHRVFAGALDRSTLSFVERTIVRAVRAAEGDFRDWDEIRGWAREIASQLRTAAHA